MTTFAPIFAPSELREAVDDQAVDALVDRALARYEAWKETR